MFGKAVRKGEWDKVRENLVEFNLNYSCIFNLKVYNVIFLV
jgi:hypothetical protein